MKAPSKPASRALAAQLRYPSLVDPNTDWIFGSIGSDEHLREAGPGQDYFFLPARRNQVWLPILVGLSGISVAEFANGEQFDKERDHGELKKRWQDCTRFSALDIHGPGGSKPDFYCAPTVTKEFFVLLNQSLALSEVVTSVTLGLPLDVDQLSSLPSPTPSGAKSVRP